MSDVEGSKGLKAGALGLVATVVIGVASTAPGYSLAASLGFVSEKAGLQAPAIMWLAFLPMACIAAAYFYLNRVDPDCGTTFPWVTRAFGPRRGWMASWGLIMADLVIMPNLAGISGRYVYLLFGLHSLAENSIAVAILGCLFIMAMTWICVIGIELSARSQVAMLGTELAVLVIFSLLALYKVYAGDLPGSVRPSLAWINPFEIPTTSALAGGLVLAVFIYWGWDTAVAVNEECEDSSRVPGLAAVLSTVILLAIYLLTTIGSQAARGPQFLAENSDDTLSAVGGVVFGGGGFGNVFQKLLIISVLTSAAASCQTTILPASRAMLSMGTHRAAPAKFAEIDHQHHTPAWSTWLFGFVSCAWYVGLLIVSENSGVDAYGASIAAVGLMIAFYFAFTGFACVAYFRRSIMRDPRAFLLAGVLPMIGALSLTYIFFKVLVDEWGDDGGYGKIFGVGAVFVIGTLLLIVGLPLMRWCQHQYPAFFQIKADPIDSRPNLAGLPPAAPLGTFTVGAPALADVLIVPEA